MFPCEFCEISKNTFFAEHIWWLLLKSECDFSIVLILKGILTFRKQKEEPMINPNKYPNKQNQKWKISHPLFERQSLCFRSDKDRESKVKRWWVGACKRKRSAFLITFILSEGIFFSICFILMYIVLNERSEYIYTVTYQKALLQSLFCLFLISSKAFCVSLSNFNKKRPQHRCFPVNFVKIFKNNL